MLVQYSGLSVFIIYYSLVLLVFKEKSTQMIYNIINTLNSSNLVKDNIFVLHYFKIMKTVNYCSCWQSGKVYIFSVYHAFYVLFNNRVRCCKYSQTLNVTTFLDMEFTQVKTLIFILCSIIMGFDCTVQFKVI